LLHLALASYTTLNGADLATTEFLLGSDRGREANPILAPFSNRPVAYGAVKMGLSAGTVWLLLRYHHDHPKLAWGLTTLGIAVEGFTVWHNYTLLPPVR